MLLIYLVCAPPPILLWGCLYCLFTVQEEDKVCRYSQEHPQTHCDVWLWPGGCHSAEGTLEPTLCTVSPPSTLSFYIECDLSVVRYRACMYSTPSVYSLHRMLVSLLFSRMTLSHQLTQSLPTLDLSGMWARMHMLILTLCSECTVCISHVMCVQFWA